jgi:hypothetical protein
MVPRTEPLAIVSLVAGIGQFVMPVVTAIVAIVCGHIARGKIKRSQGTETGSGLALAGLILGYIGLAFIVLGVAAIITVVAVFHDDWARHDARRAGREFAGQLRVESLTQGTSQRNADVIVRAWARTCDCTPNGGSDRDAQLPNGLSIWDANNRDFAAAGWQIDVSANNISTAHVCLTVPAANTVATFVDGSCVGNSS